MFSHCYLIKIKIMIIAILIKSQDAATSFMKILSGVFLISYKSFSFMESNIKLLVVTL